MRQYCITGISKLTKEREVITIPCSLPNAVEILKREKAKPPKKRSYINLKIQVYAEQKKLNFKNQ